MPEFTGDACVPKFKNCAASSLGEQPNNLSVTEPEFDEEGNLVKASKYYCQDCFEGFYWDSELEVCSMCSIDNCRDCENDNLCLACLDDFMVSPDEDKCQPRIKDPNCAIEFRQQPQGLSKQANSWICDQCKDGYVFNTQQRRCIPCAVSNCLKCSPDGKCHKCAGSLVPDIGGASCSIHTIPHCMKSVSNDGTRCDVCHSGFSVSPSGKCIECKKGCLSCQVDSDDQPQECLDCLSPLTNNGGICEF